MRTFGSNWEVTGELGQGCTNSAQKAAPATKFCKVATSMYESSVWNLLHASLLAPRFSEVAPLFSENMCSTELGKL